MKLAKSRWTLLAIAALAFNTYAAPANNKSASAAKKMPSHSLMLLGGGVEVCSSTQPSACSGTVEWSRSFRKGSVHQLDDRYIELIAQDEIWKGGREQVGAQVQAMLKFLKPKFVEKTITERELTRVWRSSDVEANGVWVSGRELYSSLTEAEKNLILDQLEVQQTQANGDRVKELVDFAATKNESSKQLLQQFVAMAAEVSKKPKPSVLVVTAAGRDPYAAVDFYLDLFKQLNADPVWFPVNSGFQAALNQADPAAACADFLTLLRKEQGTYQRGRVYPDLVVKQKDFCAEGHKGAVDQLKKADAIFFSGGDQSLLLKALKNKDGTDTPELAQLRQMYERGEIVIGGTSAGTAVMSGGNYQGSSSVMISGGTSIEAVVNGAKPLSAELLGCANSNTCGAEIKEDTLTYQPQGGLGLFSYGVLDTHFSERGRQGRLWRLLLDSGSRFGFGIDENTALLVSLQRKGNEVLTNFSVAGEGGVYVAEVTGDTNKADNNFAGLMTHYFTQDDQFSIVQGQILTEFAPWKYAQGESQQLLVNSADLFSGDTYRTMTGLFCSSQSPQATGRFTAQDKEYQVTVRRAKGSASRQGTFNIGSTQRSFCSYRNFSIQLNLVP
jgi:cyanophycinase